MFIKKEKNIKIKIQENLVFGNPFVKYLIVYFILKVLMLKTKIKKEIVNYVEKLLKIIVIIAIVFVFAANIIKMIMIKILNYFAFAIKKKVTVIPFF